VLRQRLLVALLLDDEQIARAGFGRRFRARDDAAEIFEHRALRLAEVAVGDAVAALRKMRLHVRDELAVAVAVVLVG
jgi:hypothetical protein